MKFKMMTFNVLSSYIHCKLYIVHGIYSSLQFIIECSHFGLLVNISGMLSQSFKVVKLIIIFKTFMGDLKSLFVLRLKESACKNYFYFRFLVPFMLFQRNWVVAQTQIFNPYIFANQCCRPEIFQTLTFVSSND